MEENAPVFVKIDEYKEILDIIDVLKGKVTELKNTLMELQEIKEDEDREIERWSSNLADVESKIRFIDKSIFEPEM
ncbi:hypothetical protein JW949_04580 [Candidatus Woesearchaeota archaeon]|nr:hypothetical protein [Candidatus Woesearchaeota archaeon]